MAGSSKKNPDGTWDRTRTSTSAFGTNGRISHDSSPFYERAIHEGEAEATDAEEAPGE